MRHPERAMSDPVRDLASAVAEASSSPAGRKRRRPAARARAAARSPTSATTPPTRRCCWRRRWASRRAQVAERLGSALADRLDEQVERVEVAGPGFLNLFMSDTWARAGVAGALASGDAYGAGTRRRRAHERGVRERQPHRPDAQSAAARHAAYGDSLCRILEFAGQRGGARVLRERPRQPDRALRGVDPRPGARGGSPRGRLPG